MTTSKDFRHPFLPPEEVEAVCAELCMAVYTARRRARLQLLGREPIPPASQAALDMYRDEKGREHIKTAEVRF